MNDFYTHIFYITTVLIFVIYYSVSMLLDGSKHIVVKFASIIALFCAIMLSIQRNTYLPFLGKTVLPPILFQNEISPRSGNETLTLNFQNVEDGTILIYWGALSSGEDKSSPEIAYGDFSNTGVTTIRNNRADVYFNCPDAYNVGIFNKKINKHIHYRMMSSNGIMSQVFTKYVKC